MNNHETIKLLFTGDLCPHLRVEKMCLNNQASDIYADDVQEILQDKDLSVTNLECPLTDQNNPIFKSGPALRSSPKSIASVTNGYFDVAALANNHILDQGDAGVEDTLNVCAQAGISTVGAGSNFEEASRTLYKKVKGSTLAIINATEHEFCVAKQNSYGANPLDPIKNFYQIAEAKKKANYVIMVIHGGNEHYPLPNPSVVARYRYFADLGVSAVIGHHSHFAGGYEVYNGVPIFYSLGNFVFDTDQERPAYWHRGYLVNLTFGKNQNPEVQIIPYTQKRQDAGFQLQLMRGEDKERYLDTIDGYGRIIQNKEQLQSRWKEFVGEKRNMYYAQLLGLNRVRRYMLKKSLLKNSIVDKKRIPVLANLFRCQAHREATITLLEEDFHLK